MLKSYRVQVSPSMEYYCEYDASSAQAEGAVGQVWKRMQCVSVPMKLGLK